MGMFSFYLHVMNLSFSVKTLGKEDPDCIRSSAFSRSGPAFLEEILVFSFSTKQCTL